MVLQLSHNPDSARVELFFWGEKIDTFFLLISYNMITAITNGTATSWLKGSSARCVSGRQQS